MTREQAKDKLIKKRDPGIDFIRVIACLLVIGIHVDTMGTGDSSKLLIRLLFSDGVTLFFILSGFFFFKKGFKDTLKRTLTGIVLPGVIVMLLSFQFAPFIRDESSLLYCFTHINFDIRVFITDLFSWGGSIRESLAGHLWYIFTYLELVLAYPLLKPLYTYNTQVHDKDAKARSIEKIYDGDRYYRYRWFIIGFIFINQIIMDLNMTGLISLLPVQISPFMLYTTPAMLLMIGAEIGYLKKIIKVSSWKVGVAALVICVVMFIARFFMQKLVFSYNQTQDFYLYWNCAFATVQSTAFVILVMCIDLKDNKIVNFIARAGKYTFYIYLLHYSVYYSFYYRDNPDWNFGLIDLTGGYNTMVKEFMHLFIRIPTVFLLSLLLSFIIVKIMKSADEQKRSLKLKR